MAITTATALTKWGNSTGLRISKTIADKAGLRKGDKVQLEVEAPGVLIVRAVRQDATLESLVAQITSKNRHGEADWGPPAGEEIW